MSNTQSGRSKGLVHLLKSTRAANSAIVPQNVRRWPAIPDAVNDVASTHAAVDALKQRSEIQSREAGNIADSFVTVQDLITLGVVVPSGSTFVSGVQVLKDRVAELEKYVLQDYQFYSDVTPQTVTTIADNDTAPTNWADIADFNLTLRFPRIYEYGIQVVWGLSSVNRSAFFRLVIDGVPDAIFLRQEVKDVNNREAIVRLGFSRLALSNPLPYNARVQYQALISSGNAQTLDIFSVTFRHFSAPDFQVPPNP